MSADLIKKALEAARTARIAAYDAKDADTTGIHAFGHADKAWRLLNEAEGLLAQSVYWQEAQAKEDT